MVSFTVLIGRNSLGFYGSRGATDVVETLQYQLLCRRARHSKQRRNPELFMETQSAVMTQGIPGDDDA